MTAEYALHVSQSHRLHIPHRNTHCAEMGEPLWHDKRRGGRKRWNINHRRGLYSSCHDNSDGWKILSFPSLETYWHSLPFYLDTNQIDGCRSMSPSLLVPFLALANATDPDGRCFHSAQSQEENVLGNVLVWWIVLDQSLHVLTAWCTFDLLNPSLDSRGWINPPGPILILQYKHHASLETYSLERHWQPHLCFIIRNPSLGIWTRFNSSVLLCAFSWSGLQQMSSSGRSCQSLVARGLS